MSTSPQDAFVGLFDDAAMFPPGNACADVALAEHLRYRESWFATLVGPLLVPAGSWEAFELAHQAAGRPSVAVVLIGTAQLPPAVPADVTVMGFELPVSDVPVPATPDGRSLAAEISMGAAGGRVLAAVAEDVAAGRRIVAKFRTGGTVADAFPSADVLAGVITLAVAAAAPLKLTAGLHHAVRFTDPATGFEHHGFVNVFLAFAEALAGGRAAAVVDVLEERDPATVAAAFRRLSDDQVIGVRRRFVSFGCCGVEDPVGDLVSLELLHAD